jgi:hypothetical protein
VEQAGQTRLEQACAEVRRLEEVLRVALVHGSPMIGEDAMPDRFHGWDDMSVYWSKSPQFCELDPSILVFLPIIWFLMGKNTFHLGTR